MADLEVITIDSKRFILLLSLADKLFFQLNLNFIHRPTLLLWFLGMWLYSKKIVPAALQVHSWDCGIACVIMVLRSRH